MGWKRQLVFCKMVEIRTAHYQSSAVCVSSITLKGLAEELLFISICVWCSAAGSGEDAKWEKMLMFSIIYKHFPHNVCVAMNLVSFNAIHLVAFPPASFIVAWQVYAISALPQNSFAKITVSKPVFLHLSLDKKLGPRPKLTTTSWARSWHVERHGNKPFVPY